MNFVLLFLFVNIGYLLVSVAQPVMTNGVISNLDFDHDGSGELSYAVSAEFGGELPNRWTVGFGIEPYRTSRLLRSSDSKIEFSDGELIDQLRSIYKEVVVIGGDTTREFYALPILGYTAMEKLHGLWEYKSIVDRFQTQQQILLGIRVPLESEVHYGWLRFTRSIVSSHDSFELIDFQLHPVAGEPIQAGHAPALPPVLVTANQEGYSFSWDARWGNLVLEGTGSLADPIVWTEVIVSAGGPLSIVDGAMEQAFFRLRAP